MPHQRTAIRQAVRGLLLEQTAAGTRVATTRILPYRRQELPAVSVYTLEETVDAVSAQTAPRELTRELELEIAGWVGSGGAIDDAMDALALQIETAMHADPFLGGVAVDSILLNTTMGLRGDGESLTGLVTLTYLVTYRTLAPELSGDEGLDDFLIADVHHNLGGIVDEDEGGHDIVTVQEVA